MIFFIPARRGSERVSHKNVQMVGGAPLIAWTFEALNKLADPPVREVFVSTDDPDVVELAERYKFHVLERPAHLASAEATMSDVLFHHLPDFRLAHAQEVCVLYPTSPLRSEIQIVEAVDLWMERGSDLRSLMSVTPVLHRPYGLLRIGDDNLTHYMSAQGSQYYQAQGQPPLYRANGAIYILPLKMLEGRKINSQLFSESTIPYVMDETSSFEVDTEHDLRVADILLKDRDVAPPISLHTNGVTE